MSKGFSAERKLSKKLSLWWSAFFVDPPEDDWFWKTSGSGARATERAKKGKTTIESHGDIAALHEYAKPFTKFFLVEAKRGYTSTGRMKYDRLKEECFRYLNTFRKLKRSRNKSASQEMVNGIIKLLKREVKKTKKSGGVDVLDLVDSKQALPKIYQWVEKAITQKNDAHRPAYLLFIKRDMKKWAVVMGYETYLTFLKASVSDPVIVFQDGGIGKHAVVSLSDFFDRFVPEALLKAVAPEMVEAITGKQEAKQCKLKRRKGWRNKKKTKTS